MGQYSIKRPINSKIITKEKLIMSTKKKFVTDEQIVKLPEVWEQSESYKEIAEKLDLTIPTIKFWGKKINSEYPDKCKAFGRKVEKAENRIKRLFAA